MARPVYDAEIARLKALMPTLDAESKEYRKAEQKLARMDRVLPDAVLEAREAYLDAQAKLDDARARKLGKGAMRTRLDARNDAKRAVMIAQDAARKAGEM